MKSGKRKEQERHKRILDRVAVSQKTEGKPKENRKETTMNMETRNRKKQKEQDWKQWKRQKE